MNRERLSEEESFNRMIDTIRIDTGEANQKIIRLQTKALRLMNKHKAEKEELAIKLNEARKEIDHMRLESAILRARLQFYESLLDKINETSSKKFPNDKPAKDNGEQVVMD